MLTDSDDTEMFDHDEEDKDLESQVPKGKANLREDDHETRNEREDTPGPQLPTNDHEEKTSEALKPQQSSPAENISADAKVLTNSALPEKLVTPSKVT